MATYLVTGGCGFIGSHLCDALIDDGHKVRVLDDLSTGRVENLHPSVDLEVGDVSDKETVGKAMSGIDGCFHLAAIASVERTVQEWPETHRINLTGAVNIFDAARSARLGKPVPVVYASSAAAYGDNASMPLKESETPRPLTPYGADKLGCELHARVATIMSLVPTTGFRFFNVYGPRQDPASPYSGVISIFADRLIRKQPILINGDGQQVRDFIYVGDVVCFLLAGMKQKLPEARVFNVCTGRATTIVQLAKTLSSITGTDLVIEKRPARVGDIRVSLGNPGKALRGLGVQALTSLGDGLKITIESLKYSQQEAA